MHRRPAGSIGQRELDACYFALNQHALVSRTDARGDIIFVNDKFCEVSGYTRDELIGKNHRVLNSGFHPAAFFDGMWARLASGQVWQGVIRNQTKAGDYFWAISTIVPELGEHGLPVSYLSLRTDITASLKIERSLQRSEERYRLLAENMHDAVLLLGLDGRVQYASPSAGTLLDCEAQRLAADGHAALIQATLHDLTTRMVADLQRAKEAAEKASLAKSEFLSRMSHELRTPLNSILGFAQLLEMQGADLSAVQRDRVGRIIESGWRLRTLVDEVLDLAPGAPPFQLEDVDLAGLLDECLRLLEPAAAQRRLGIVAGPLPLGAQSVRADPMRLKQVLMNLLSNAVKFNRDGGSVTIACSLAGSGKVRVTISDTGPGIAAERQVELFKPFSRLDADKAETPGSGIGLALSLRLMERMDGRIGVDSAPGRGCAFWIEVASTVFAGPPVDGAARDFF